MGRRAILLAVYLLVAVGTPIGHSVVVGLHVLREHTGVPTPGDWLNARFEAMLEATRLEWGLELAHETSPEGEHRHGNGEPHLHPPAPDPAHSHGGSATPVEAPGRHGEMPADAGPVAESADRLAGDAAHMAGEHAHDGYVHSHDTDPTQDLAHLTANLSKHFLPPPATPFSPATTAEAAPWPYVAVASDVYSTVLIPPPRLS